MEHKKLNRLIGTLVFLVSFFTFFLTVQPSVSFWDCGEFLATAYTLAVPHPPGAPFFLILGRTMGMVLPFIKDPALRINLISVTGSAFTVLFLYLISVRVIMKWRGVPQTFLDRLILYGSAAVGALAYNFSDTFWFNAVEAEVYASSMFFVSIAVWLGLVWYEKADEEGNEKYLVLIAYLMGLSIGIHQLSLLTFFTIATFIYFRRSEFQLKSFISFTVVTILAFFVVYPGIVNILPDVLDGSLDLGPISIKDNDLLPWLPLLVVLALVYGIYYSWKHQKKILNVACLSMLVIIIGYSTYTQVLIRASAKTPVNENNPDNMARFVSYMNREQYGEPPPQTKRRWSQEPIHIEAYKRYTSDWDYFLKYQTYEMFLRYLGWNFVGKAGDIQGAPVELFGSQPQWYEGKGFPNRYYGIPFLLALFGVWHHFKKDWRFALSFGVLFAVTGLALAIYFNMAEPQPRERDYFFVGCFFVVALWIGIGVAGILEYLEEAVREKQNLAVYAGSSLALLFLVCPMNMAFQNWFDHDRSKNYVPWDYSYNILQSCEKDAIVFTNGDNDTFPLWYLQEVEHVRTDVRVVCLSLLNTSWYILQLKNEEPHGAKKVPMSFSDAQVENLHYTRWTPRDIDIPVPKEVFEKYGVSDTSVTNKGKITFRMPSTLQGYDESGKTIGAIRVQDIMVRDMVLTSKWQRPIYFAVTVAEDGKIGLQEYLQMEGLAMKLTPVKLDPRYDIRAINEEAMRENLLNEPQDFYREPHRGFRFRGLNDPSIYYNENDRRLMVNYRTSFLRLALYYGGVTRDTAKVTQVYGTMEKKISRDVFSMDWRLLYDFMGVFYRAGMSQYYQKTADELEKISWNLIEHNLTDLTSDYNPYNTLMQIYEIRKDYQRQIDVLNRVLALYPNDKRLKDRIAQLEPLAKAQSDSAKLHPEKN